jgi:hypothetical protein
MRALLDDPARLAGLSAAGPGAVAACDHRRRAHEYVAAFRTLAEDRQRTAPAIDPKVPDALLVVATVDPSVVPATRADWHDLWRAEVPGGSRTQRLVRLLAASDKELCVVALDPDAARHVDALVVACAAEATGRVVHRSVDAAPAQTPLDHPWALVAAPRAALLTALRGHPDWYGLEAAILELGAQRGADVLPGGGIIDLAARYAWLVAAGETGSLSPQQYGSGLQALTHRAAHEQRTQIAAEAAGRAALLGLPTYSDATLVAEDCGQPSQPPLAEPVDDEAFLLFDPQRPETLAAIADHARRGPEAEPLVIAVGVWSGLPVEHALETLAGQLTRAGVDLDRGPDMRLLERPIWAVEAAWLLMHARVPQPAQSSDGRQATA